jgi:macrolide transport system ATP-binding/permease protein
MGGWAGGRVGAWAGNRGTRSGTLTACEAGVALREDVRYSVRALARTPGFAAALVASAAIGIGANAVVFGFIGHLADPATVMSDATVGVDAAWLGRLNTIRLLLTAVSAFVFVIAAASVIGLLLSRGAARVHETSVRVALGAHGRDLFRPLLAEGFVVGVAAIACGLLAAFWTVEGLPAAFYDGDVEAMPFAVDWIGLAIATLAGVLVIGAGALAPLVWTSRRRPKPDSRGSGPGLANTFSDWRSTLVVTQLTLCAVLLISTGAVVDHLDNALRTDHAARTGDAVVVRLEKLVRVDAFVDALREQFGEPAIGLTHVLPGGLVAAVDYRQVSAPPESAALELGTNVIGGTHLDLVGLMLTLGRTFDAGDTVRSRGVALVNEAAVPLLLGQATTVLGMTLVNPEGYDYEIIGVVREAPFRTLQPRARPMIYFAYHQRFPSTLSLIVGTDDAQADGLTAAVAASVESAAAAKHGRVTTVTTLQEHLTRTSTAADRLVLGVVRVFAGLAIVLSLIGVTGVTSDAVARRTPEIALRMALGAPRWRIVSGVVAYGVRLALLGATAGLLLCAAGFRFVEPLPDSARGPAFVVWVAAPAVLVVMVVVGTLLPARRALAVDPAMLLRE